MERVRKSRQRTGFKRVRTPGARSWACSCCGRLVVLLKKDIGNGEIRWICCYARGWDGNPWFTPFQNTVHPRKRKGVPIWLPREQEKDDDLFSL